MLLQAFVEGPLFVRKEVIWWMITVVLIEVVPPRDGRRAVRQAATVSTGSPDLFEKTESRPRKLSVSGVVLF